MHARAPCSGYFWEPVRVLHTHCSVKVRSKLRRSVVCQLTVQAEQFLPLVTGGRKAIAFKILFSARYDQPCSICGDDVR